MSKFLRRINKLEARLTDPSGFAPNSLQWLSYWTDRVSAIFGEPDCGTPGCIPLQVVDALLGNRSTL